MRFLKTFSLQFVRVWAGIPNLSGMWQNCSCSVTSKHLQRFGIVSEFQFETHKTRGSCRANCIAFNQKQSVVPLAIGLNICDGLPFSAHLHRELNSTYSSTCDNCMSESSLKKENIFSTAPDVLSVILWRYGEGEKNMKRVIPGRTLIVKSK